MTAAADLRHPVALLVDALVAALQDDAAPTKGFSPRVYILPDDTVLPEEALPPFYGIIVRDGKVDQESSDDQEWVWPIEIGAYQVLEAPTLAARVTGLAPFAPGARAGLLDLVWAANRTIRGRGLGKKYGRFRLVGETATGVVISGDGNEASVLVRRALKFEFDVGVSFTPLT
jgi:hypothetical protein